MTDLDKYYVAIDLGASSGRVLLAGFGDEQFDLQIIHRFPNEIRQLKGHLRWNARKLFNEIKFGLKKVAELKQPVVSLGVDTWGVDYGLFNENCELVEEPICYRDARTEGMMDAVFKLMPGAEIFQKTGIQFLPINTLFQLFAQRKRGEWPAGAIKMLMMPDIFHYFLTGKMTGEFTNATTTQLLNANTKLWDAELFRELDLPSNCMPEIMQPGETIGTLIPHLQTELGMASVNIVAPATHDTASAVAGAPLKPGWAYISSGTWSLVGIETNEPIINTKAAQYNFTNEGGVYGTNRFLKNVMGMWLLESCRQIWKEQNQFIEYKSLMQQMKAIAPFQGFIYVDDLRFLHPANMIQEIIAYLHESRQKAPQDQVSISKIILESLAMRYASVLNTIQTEFGVQLQGIQIIGGGSQNDFLNQATANATGLEVVAGPVEATAIGNVLIQAIADGRFSGLSAGRTYIRNRVPLKKYSPVNRASWQVAFNNYKELECSKSIIN